MSKKTVTVAAVVSGVAGLIIGGAAGGASTTGDPNPTSTVDANQVFPSSDTSSSEPPPVADPAGTYTSSCDYILGDFTDNTASGYRFVAQAVIKNTGNIGTVDTVTVRWFQSGTKPVVASKVVQVKAGANRRIGLTEQVSQNEIDLLQSLGYGDNCKVKVTIGDTFGQPS